MPTPVAIHHLSRPLALLCLAVERFCLRDLSLRRGSNLLLAVSGGADSTALACIFALLRPRLELKLSALSIDHGLRPEGMADARHAATTCHGLAIPCRIAMADVLRLAHEQKIGIEEAARRARYALLESARTEMGADFILLGHHAEDLSEDILLRLLRGTGWPALGGMLARDDARHLLRPLLHSSPDALKRLVRHMELDWREDASNNDSRFKRNRLRHKILPLLRQENPALESASKKLWQMARWDEEFFESQLAEALAATPPSCGMGGGFPRIILSRELLASLHPALRLRLFHRIVRQFYTMLAQQPHLAPNNGQARADTLFKLETALQEGRGNTYFQLPGGLIAYLQGGSICFAHKKAGPVPNDKPGHTDILD